MNRQHNRLILNIAQILIWGCAMLLPAGVTWLISGDSTRSAMTFWSSFHMLMPICLVYLINYFLLVPKLLFRKQIVWFVVLNLVLLTLLNLPSFVPRGEIPEPLREHIQRRDILAFRIPTLISAGFFQLVFIFLAIGARSIIRSNDIQFQLQEEKRKTAEAELTWLKHQLNPHFLFNTLNNISSLTQIDPDKAQESIGQLSDTLRYALYDTDVEKVPLSGEVSFMDNYVHLMQLRCNEMTDVSTSWQVPSGDVKIAPLLFISPIENAFKHGVNTRMKSFVHIGLRPEGRDLVFTCENSLFEKTGEDHIGSGIGMENLKRRLELIYPDAYSYEHDEKDGAYHVRIVLKNLLA
ncbi:MAG: histidine kinase [Bacteroidales bacterium]|nr:histidine kinase [Bacteroidales bacterium]